ncbi:MAG: tripartite tricarboxylate transporter substrate binding protein [Betaproteobacteria bacterium]|nr:MAG: tripartite tricarboxylate transporter substrate binding protein [Betaproteobacteria bacterium]
MKLVLLLAALLIAPAHAFPDKPVRVIVAFTPGGVTDIVARTLAAKLAELWKQPVVVENRAGAGGSLAAVAVARASADGYTLLVHSSGYAVNAALNPALPYDPQRELVAVAPLASQAMVLVVNPAAGPKSVPELIAAAKAEPGALAYGSAGIGSGAHFSAEQFRIAAGIEVLHVPYKGGAEAINDTAAGRLAFTFNTITLALPYIRDGRLLALGVTSLQRSDLLPHVPTIAEGALPGFEFTFWNGLWAPAGTPAPLAEQIARDLGRAVTASDVRERFARLGAEPMTMTPPEFARFVQREIDNAERIARISGIKAQ